MVSGGIEPRSFYTVAAGDGVTHVFSNRYEDVCVLSAWGPGYTPTAYVTAIIRNI